MTRIAKLDAVSTVWSNFGNLVYKRHGHNAIFDGSVFLIFGGNSGDPGKLSEKCFFSGESLSCTEQPPKLVEYRWQPELLLVESDFGKNIGKC